MAAGARLDGCKQKTLKIAFVIDFATGIMFMETYSHTSVRFSIAIVDQKRSSQGKTGPITNSRNIDRKTNYHVLFVTPYWNIKRTSRCIA